MNGAPMSLPEERRQFSRWHVRRKQASTRTGLCDAVLRRSLVCDAVKLLLSSGAKAVLEHLDVQANRQRLATATSAGTTSSGRWIIDELNLDIKLPDVFESPALDVGIKLLNVLESAALDPGKLRACLGGRPTTGLRAAAGWRWWPPLGSVREVCSSNPCSAGGEG